MNSILSVAAALSDFIAGTGTCAQKRQDGQELHFWSEETAVILSGLADLGSRLGPRRVIPIEYGRMLWLLVVLL